VHQLVIKRVQLNVHLHEFILLHERKKRMLFLLRHVTSVTAVYFSSINEHEGKWGVQKNKQRFLKMHVQYVTGVFKWS